MDIKIPYVIQGFLLSRYSFLFFLRGGACTFCVLKNASIKLLHIMFGSSLLVLRFVNNSLSKSVEKSSATKF